MKLKPLNYKIIYPLGISQKESEEFVKWAEGKSWSTTAYQKPNTEDSYMQMDDKGMHLLIEWLNKRSR